MKPGREFDSRQGHENFLCPGRASFLLLPSWKYSLEVCVLLTSASLKLIKIKINLIYATTSSWEKKWRVKGKWCRLILFFFLWSEFIFLWSELIQVQFYFICIFLFDPSRSELIPARKCSFVQCRKYHTSRRNGAAELHISVDLLCGITAAAELRISIDLLFGITAAELHNSVGLLCGTTAA